MFKNKIAISKNFLIAVCFISLILFAINNVNAMDLNDTSTGADALGVEADCSINAIDEDKLGNSQQDILSQGNALVVNGGKFSKIQDLIHYNLSDGDTLILNGEFTTDRAESHIIVYKNITFTSTSQATFDAKGLSSIFVVEYGGSGSSFSNLIFKNGNGRSGGAMLVYGKDVEIDNCLFQNNYASRGGGAIYTEYYVENHPDYGRNLLIKNSEFINNSAAITAGAIGAYGYNTRILNCLFESNSVYNPNGGSVYGGAIQVGKEEFITNSLIKDCKFIRNKAVSVTGSQLSHGGASCLRDGITYENCVFEGNSADFGGALTSHCSGTIRNCTFKSNTANDYGGAISNVDGINSMNLNIIDCDFKSNSAPYGGAIKLAGYSITISDCNFDNNYASIDGGAVFVDTKTLGIYDSSFNYNSAEHNAGAVFVNGESTTVQTSTFRHNTAIANPNVKDDGLGGAIYINGTLDSVNNNKFEYNVARNGSAIYYDKSGKDLKVTNNVMTKNQAWVYALPIYAKDIYYGESEKIGAVIYGGNNIADYDNLAVSNAIYNAASNRYIKVNGETPVLGATNSGQLYQDSREYNIDVLLTVKHSDGTVVYNNTLKSNYLGEVSKVLNNLKVGTYTVTATHFEDNYYKAISNQTTFVVKSQIDVAVSKGTTYSEYNYHDQVVWTINVVNNGPNDATGVKVNDVLPAGLVYRSSTASVGSYSNGVWNIGNLAKSKTATLKITTLVNKTGEIINKATVSATEFDWNTTNNQDSQKITVSEAADLAITKAANVTSPNYGDLVKWTLTVKNNGPDIAHEVTVTDVVPSGLVFRSSNGNYAGGKWSVGTLNVGQSKSLEIITLVNKTGNIKNTASVTGKEHDYNLANNEASKAINVPKAADLAVTKVVNITNPNFADLVKWTITVRNLGPDASSGVKVSDILPSGLVYQSSTASLGSYSNGVWTIGNLAKGASASLSIVSKVNKTGAIKNTASVTGNEYDIDKTNNNAEASINVANAADLAVTKTSNVTSPNYGDLVKWTITVKNNGPSTATEVVVSDVIPNGLVFRSSNGNYAGGKWSVGTLNVGQSKSLEIITLVNKTGNIKNTASVTGKEHDYNLANNEASKAINVPKAADLAVTKVVNITNPNFADLVKWTITVRNLGPDASSGVKVNDILPSGLIYQSSSASVGSYSNGVWTIGNLAKGASVSLNIVSKVNKTGAIKNTASVSGNEYDIDKTNNKAEASINVANAADLAVTKTSNVTSPNYGDLVKWTVTVRNNGPDVANDIVLTDVLPSGLIIKSSTGNYANSKWTIGSLNVGQSRSFEIVTLVNKTGSLTNKVSVVGKEHDYNLANNNASKTISVPKAADLAVTKIVNNTAPNYHDLVKWTLTVRNLGPDASSGVKVNDILPEGLIYQSSSASLGSYSNGVWTIGNLAKGASASLNIVCMVNKTGSIRNTASVTGNEYDIGKTNNNAEASIIVAKAADLAITKTSNVTSPNYGDLVKWTLTVKNNGPDTATEVVVSDVIPGGLIFKSSNGNYANGKWSVGTLNVGQSKSLEIITLVNKTGNIKNTAGVRGKEYDYNLANNNASKTISVPKAADLAVTKIVNNTAPNYAGLVKWTLTVRNLGPDASTGVKVSDVLPAGLIYRSSAASIGSYVNGVWTIGNLAKGASASLDIVCLVNKTGSIRNTATVSGIEYDINKTNNVADKIIDVPKASDLEIIKSVNNTSPNYHDLVKWNLTVRNNGPDDAHNVFVDDILPSGLIVKSTTGNFTGEKFFVGTLNAFSSKTLEIVTYINKTGLLTNNANVSGDEYDYNKSNNKDNSSIDVPPSADLEITKIVSTETPLYKSNLKWIIVVKNNGPDKATGVEVSEILSDAFALVKSDASKGYYNGRIWSIDNLNVGETVSLEIITSVVKTGNFTNVVHVTGKEYDYNLANNKAIKSIEVYPAIDLEISKRVNNTSPNYNDLVKWTITVRNNGPDKANSIEISDILPKGLEFVSYNATKGFYTDGFWKFCCLEVRESQTLEIIARIKAIGEIKNIVAADAKEYDYYPNNNKDESIVNVAPACDLEVIKLANQSAVNYKESVKWTLIVKNNGPSDATRVVVSESLPEGLTFISAQGDGTYSTAGLWYVGDIACGQTKELTIITRFDRTGEFNNVVVVKADQYDYNPSNDKAEKTVTAAPAADLAITKMVEKVQYAVGDLISYRIELTNNGPDTARNINVTEIIDDSLEFESAFAASGDYDDVNHIWHIKSLDSGEKTFLNIKAVAKKEGLVSNVVSAISDTFDYNLENNLAECIVEIIKNIIDPQNPFNPGLNSRFGGYGFIVKDLGEVANASIEMKETGIPIALLIVFALLSFALCTSNISKKR